MDGGMAEFMLVPHARHLVPLPEPLDPVTAAPLTDAALTPYHAVRRSWSKLVPGTTAVVIGIGGLGHLAVQIVKATTAVRVARTLGDLTIVGLGGGTLPVSFFALPYELSVQTTYWGSRPELVEVLDLAARGLVHTKITRFGLAEAPEAYRLLEAGGITGRAVVVPSEA